MSQIDQAPTQCVFIATLVAANIFFGTGRRDATSKRNSANAFRKHRQLAQLPRPL